MRIWAFGTSPHGLGLTERQLWVLSLREFRALEDVQQAPARRWAVQQSIVCNLNISSDSEPFIADDFLGLGNRDLRVQKRQESQLAAMKANRKLLQMKRGRKGEKEPEDIPDWARG